MTDQRRVPLSVLGIVCALAWADSARAAQPTSSAARDLAHEGYELKLQKRWDAALEKLAASLRLESSPKTLMNLAECEAELGKFVEAQRHLVEARDATKNDPELSSIAADRLMAVEKRLPHLTLHLASDAPADTEVVLDGVVVPRAALDSRLPANPGAHAIVASASGRSAQRWDVTMHEAETKGIEVSPGTPSNAAAPPPPAYLPDTQATVSSTPGPWRTIGIIGVGAGVIGLGVGSVLAVLATSSKCPDNRCATAEAKADHVSGVQKADIATVAFIAGGALVAIGATFWLLAPARRAQDRTNVSANVRVGPGTVSLVGAW
jgi:hypothetical protein